MNDETFERFLTHLDEILARQQYGGNENDTTRSAD